MHQSKAITGANYDVNYIVAQINSIDLILNLIFSQNCVGVPPPIKHEILTKCWITLGQRRRRWANCKSGLGESLLFYGLPNSACVSHGVFTKHKTKEHKKTKRSNPLSTNSRTHLYPESTALITEMETTGIKLKPETYIKWSIVLMLTHTRIYTMSSRF